MRIIEGILIDGEDIFVGVLFAGNLSDSLKGFAEMVGNRNPRRAAIGVSVHGWTWRRRDVCKVRGEREAGGERNERSTKSMNIRVKM